MKKYILLLFSVFAFGQASNQMVTFTQAQSLGFALKAGQSHVTSNQCMTKSDALAKYNIDASAMSSYANNQLVPRSAWVAIVNGDFLVTAQQQSTFLGYVGEGGTLSGSINPSPPYIYALGAGVKINMIYSRASDKAIVLVIYNGSTTVQPSGWTQLNITPNIGSISSNFLIGNARVINRNDGSWSFAWNDNSVTSTYPFKAGEVSTCSIIMP